MPIEFGLWRIDGDNRRLSAKKLDEESRLEDLLADDPNMLGRELLVLGRQVRTASGNFIDLLGIDADGDLHIIELKRDRTPREVVAQALDYASYIRDLSYDEIAEIHDDFSEGTEFEAAFSDRFGSARPEGQSGVPEDINQSHNLIIVSSELDAATERIIEYLSDEYNVPINAIRFNYYRDEDDGGTHEYIGRTWLIDPQDVPEPRDGREAWNERDFYANFGEGETRSWDDARQYGFVAAGQGKWYQQTLDQLFVGARIFAYSPGDGYIGVGEVTIEKTPVTDFDVGEGDEQKNILDADLEAEAMGRNKDDSEMREYLVGVDWDETRPISDAYWEKGMYAQQNTVTKLRNKFTLRRLYEEFSVNP